MFTLGFSKTAAFDHNNQGLEFKMSDMGSGNVGAGGMAPSGIPSYQPFDNNKEGGGQKLSRKARARMAINAMYKFSSGMSDAGLSDSGGSDIASGTVDQLKWTSQNGPTLEQEADDRKEQKNRRKAYLKSRIRE
jgi:hypothetical protein